MQAVAQGQAPKGVPLLAAAAALRRAMGAPVRPADRSSLEGALAAARAALGNAVFASTWATGQSLPLEQVAALALAATEGRFAVGEPAIGR